MIDSITSSQEDYLEGILLIQKDKKIVRAKDVVEYFGVKGSSVNETLKNLKKRGMIIQEKYGYIELTPRGLRIARNVYRKHTLLTKFIENILGVSAETAEEDACKIEHHLSKETLDNILYFIEFTDRELERKYDLKKSFKLYIQKKSKT